MGPPLPPLEPGRRPQPGTWYRLRPRGAGPSGRVGHGCLPVPGGPGRVLLLGGADPDGAFADAHVVELGSLRWAQAGWRGLRPRYEHATFLPARRPPRLWVFGGAHRAGNRSCVQALDPETGTWESPAVAGTPPLPRTFHTSSAAIGDRLYVFGGGDKGAEPVQDQQLHVFDTATCTWSQPDTRGDPPSPRHGHVVVAVGTKLLVHGGLAGDVFYNDLFCIDTREQRWTLLQFDAPLPAGRLDHAMCVVPWRAGGSGGTAAGAAEEEAEGEPAAPAGGEADLLQGSQDEEGRGEDPATQLLFVFGGMDTQGEIFRDCLVTVIE
ncbi:rab9 effector protein with kelch motifs isoform X2 [Cygnus atratus]|uniref:rab9 effector protein with kelch motifs isoform X2 n=1 Tax=Cygnus atratus TaxID=8868 RepID=UPI0021B6E9A6|nr:rab9 effector protein with kelch motifs isoform X2 [Cygnus atratus]